MIRTPVVVNLPVADRRTSFTFYHSWLGFDAIGEPARTAFPSRCSSRSMRAFASC